MTDSHGMQKCQIQDSNQQHLPTICTLPAPTAFFIEFFGWYWNLGQTTTKVGLK